MIHRDTTAYGGGMIPPGQFPAPPTPNPIPLSEDQESQIAAGFVSAQLALLDAISREARSEASRRLETSHD
jgi:hypothetical protein